jgi:hypothetical protein
VFHLLCASKKFMSIWANLVRSDMMLGSHPKPWLIFAFYVNFYVFRIVELSLISRFILFLNNKVLFTMIEALVAVEMKLCEQITCNPYHSQCTM